MDVNKSQMVTEDEFVMWVSKLLVAKGWTKNRITRVKLHWKNEFRKLSNGHWYINWDMITELIKNDKMTFEMN